MEAGRSLSTAFASLSANTSIADTQSNYYTGPAFLNSVSIPLRYRARNGDFCSEECPDILAGGLVDKSNMVDKAEVEPTVVTSVETDEAKELGVLGSIFKFLVEANTWGEVPASIPSAAEVEVEEEEEDNDLKEDVEVEMER